MPGNARPNSSAATSGREVPLWLLALFTFSGTLAMHIFVPALPIVARDLEADVGSVQLTVSLYILGLAVGQLIYGPLSDRYGRRPVLIGGLLVYTLAGFAATFAAGISSLILARLLQALGGCAGLVLGRAMVRDTAGAQDAGRRMALMNLMVTLGPGVAPLIGSALATSVGWRPILFLLGLLGLLNLALACLWLPETGRPGSGAGGNALLRSYGWLLRSRAFLGFTIGGSCATTSMYAFIGSAPFIITGELGRSTNMVGISLAVLIAGVWLGSMLASRLIARVPLNRLATVGNAVSLVAALVLLGSLLCGQLSFGLIVTAMFAYTIGGGLASPAAMTQAISVDATMIGAASGLYGCAQMAVGAACTALGALGHDPALATAMTLVGASVVAQCAFRMASRGGG